MMGLGMRFRALVAAVGVLFLAVTVDAVADSKVNSVRLWRAPDNTRLVFDLTGPVQHSVFTLTAPDRLVFDIVADTEELQLFRIDQTVQVEMEGANVANLVGFDQRERRTFYRPDMPKPANNPPRQRGFPRAQIPFKKNQTVPLCRLGDARTKRGHRRFISQVQGYFRHGACSSNN